MKKHLLLLFFPLVLFGDEQRLLLSGFSIHEKKYNRFEEPYNARNYGLGYEYNFYKEDKQFYFGMNGLLLQDSFYNPQLTLGLGHYIRFDLGPIESAIGLSGFIGWKKIYDDGDSSRDEGRYGLTGGIAPALNFYYGDAAINLMYVPSFHYRDIDITGFLFTYFSWRF